MLEMPFEIIRLHSDLFMSEDALGNLLGSHELMLDIPSIQTLPSSFSDVIYLRGVFFIYFKEVHDITYLGVIPAYFDL